jgi:hypothetical protein
VIVNRADQALAIPTDKVAQFMGVPVAATFSDDHFWVNLAIGGAGTLINDGKGQHSKLAREFRAFARVLLAPLPGEAESGVPQGSEVPQDKETGEMLAVA